MKPLKLKDIAADTLQILEQGYYINPSSGQMIYVKEATASAIEGTITYSPETLEEIRQSFTGSKKYSTTFEVINETTLDAMRRLHSKGHDKIMLLNFASARNPGGGFLRGAPAQEESIARVSGLYPCLSKDVTYYNYNRSRETMLYSDYMIYSPGVPVFKNEDGSLMNDFQSVSIITAAAVNAGELMRHTPEAANEIEPVMRIRTEKVLSLAAKHSHETLILGAWGCGVFKNDPEMIAALFHEAIHGKYKGHFRHIAFAVKTKDESMIQTFRQRFSPYELS
ncbi:TIGR02452 family protein [Chitinophagaceae bacterium MMS25-I14]